MLQPQRRYYLLVILGLQTAAAFGTDWPVLSLADAIERALKRHAAIPAAEAKRQSAEGLALQSRARPNPAFTFQMENWRFDASPAFRPGNDVDWFAFVSQRIEAGGKRAKRADVGRQNASLAELELDLLKWNVRQEVRRAYYRGVAGSAAASDNNRKQ
jgi:outer membrane protein TolC